MIRFNFFFRIFVVASLCLKLGICSWNCCIFALTEWQLNMKYLRKDKAKQSQKKKKKKSFSYFYSTSCLPFCQHLKQKTLAINISTNIVTDEKTEKKLHCENTTKNIISKYAFLISRIEYALENSVAENTELTGFKF